MSFPRTINAWRHCTPLGSVSLVDDVLFNEKSNRPHLPHLLLHNSVCLRNTAKKHSAMNVQRHGTAKRTAWISASEWVPRHTAAAILTSLTSTFHQHCSYCRRTDFFEDRGRYSTWHTRVWISSFFLDLDGNFCHPATSLFVAIRAQIRSADRRI